MVDFVFNRLAIKQFNNSTIKRIEVKKKNAA